MRKMRQPIELFALLVILHGIAHAVRVPRNVAIAGGVAATFGAMRPACAKPLLSEVVAALDAQVTERNINGAPAKHIPKVRVDPTVTKVGIKGFSSQVDVAVPHVMEGEPRPHWIEYIWLKDTASGAVIAAKKFTSGDASPPIMTAYVPHGTTATPLAYCNQHGLWEGESFKI